MSAFKSKSAAALFMAVALVSTTLATEPAKPTPAADSKGFVKVAATRAALRDLWMGHIFWVREVVVHLAAKDAKAAQTAEGEVVANAKQIAGALEPFYGKAASDGLFKLLAGHYGAVKAHAQATLSKDDPAAKMAMDELVANAGEIAKFLSNANPYLPQATLLSLLTAHGSHHATQNQQIAARQFGDEARSFEMMKKHIYTVADALADALAKQFPDKF